MAITVNDKDLGIVTAYGYAVSKGYAGTEEEYAELMASYADVAEDAADSAATSEAYAIGKRNGVDVDASDSAYHNNSKYYAEQAADVAESIPSDYTELSEEIDALKNDFDAIDPIFDDYFETVQHTETTTNAMQWTSREYYKLDTGELASAGSNYSHTEKFQCSAGDVIGVSATTGQVLFWSNDNYIDYVATSPSTAMSITAPNGAMFYALNNRNIDDRPTETTVQKTWTENTLVKKEFSAPAQVLYKSTDFVNKAYASTANGNLYTGDSYATWYCAYKIPCKPAHRYRTTIQTQVCFYDASGTFLSAYIPTIDGVNCSGVKVEMDFTTPSGCEYFSINSNSANEIVFDMEYEEYGNGKSVYQLIGETVVCFGDSITGNYYFGDNYPYQIEEKTGAKVYDVGFGGCRMEISNDPNINYINPFSMVSLADAIASDAPDKWSTQDASVSSFAANRVVRLRLDILKSIDFSNVDIVTIAYGTNGLENPIDNPNNPLDTYSYAGAARYAVRTLLEKYPHLRIVFLTPVYRWYSATSDDGDTHAVNGHTLLQRVTKLLEVGNEVKLPTIDLYHTLGINKYNYTGYFGDEDESADGTHLNSFGREQMGLRIAGELNRLF